MPRYPSALIAFFSLSLIVSGQSAHQHGSSPESATGLLPNAGEYAFPISATNAEAQRYFNQGVAMIYGFNHDEAQRLFRRAAELDPKTPMPWWGIALSLGSHINNDPENTREALAWEAISKARLLAANSPVHEKRYVEALAVRYSADAKADRKQLARNYRAAMAALHRDFPDDPDAATLYAESIMNLNPWKYWTKDGKPEEDTLEFVSILESVLRRVPEHPGANHYYIHAVEASPNPERALAAANRLGKLVPAAGHLVHMPSHIYARTGMWQEAAQSNAEAVRVDRAYLHGKPQNTIYPLMYYPHNIHFLLYANMAQGDCAGAAQAARDLYAQVSPGLDMMPMLQGFVGYTYQLSVACPAVLLAAPPASKYALATVAWQYANGTLEARKGNTAKVREALDAMRTAAKNVAPETIYAPEFTAAYLEVAQHSLEARLAGKDYAAAIEHWKQAVAAQDRLRYDEPPIWFYQVRQSLAAAYFQSGQFDLAEKALRESLQVQIRDPRTLFLLWKTLEAKGWPREAALIEAEFRSVWKAGAEPPKVTDL